MPVSTKPLLFFPGRKKASPLCSQGRSLCVSQCSAVPPTFLLPRANTLCFCNGKGPSAPTSKRLQPGRSKVNFRPAHLQSAFRPWRFSLLRRCFAARTLFVAAFLPVIIQRSRAVCKGRFEKGLFPAFAGFFFAGKWKLCVRE